MRVTTIRSGTFSGSAISIVRALREISQVSDVDVMPYAREPRSVPWRVIANLEAARAGGVPWAKTATWTKCVQARLERSGFLAGDTPVVFVQSLHGCVPDKQVDYLVYTDRVGLEGATAGGEFRSRFSPGWLKRETEFLRRARRVLVMGPSTKQVLIDRYALPPEQIEVVGAGPNCPLGPPVEATSCRTFLFVGTQWELKGGPTLLAAFERLRERCPDAELLLVGGSHPQSLPEGVRALGRIPQERMDEVYSQAHALVIPTHMEAFGISLVEAIIKGLPCIGSTVGNQSYIIGDAGICVDAGDTGALEMAMGHVIESYAGYAARARLRGRSLSTTMDWRRIARRILNEFSGIRDENFA